MDSGLGGVEVAYGRDPSQGRFVAAYAGVDEPVGAYCRRGVGIAAVKQGRMPWVVMSISVRGPGGEVRTRTRISPQRCLGARQEWTGVDSCTRLHAQSRPEVAQCLGQMWTPVALIRSRRWKPLGGHVHPTFPPCPPSTCARAAFSTRVGYDHVLG